LVPPAVPPIATSLPVKPVTGSLKTTVKLMGPLLAGSAWVPAWLMVPVGEVVSGGGTAAFRTCRSVLPIIVAPLEKLKLRTVRRSKSAPTSTGLDIDGEAPPGIERLYTNVSSIQFWNVALPAPVIVVPAAPTPTTEEPRNGEDSPVPDSVALRLPADRDTTWKLDTFI
jgi:hypothetical protein